MFILTSEWYVLSGLHRDRWKYLNESLANHHSAYNKTQSQITLEEITSLAGNYELQLNIFRRNIALRANRVLMPARNAQIFAQLINVLIAADEFPVARAVVEYVGLTPSTYCQHNKMTSMAIIDLQTILSYVSRKMLEVDIGSSVYFEVVHLIRITICNR